MSFFSWRRTLSLQRRFEEESLDLYLETQELIIWLSYDVDRYQTCTYYTYHTLYLFRQLQLVLYHQIRLSRIIHNNVVLWSFIDWEQRFSNSYHICLTHNCPDKFYCMCLPGRIQQSQEGIMKGQTVFRCDLSMSQSTACIHNE